MCELEVLRLAHGQPELQVRRLHVVDDVHELEDHARQDLGPPEPTPLAGPQEDLAHVVGVAQLGREPQPQVLLEVAHGLVEHVAEALAVLGVADVDAVRAQEAIDVVELFEREALPVDDRVAGEEDPDRLDVLQADGLGERRAGPGAVDLQDVSTHVPS